MTTTISEIPETKDTPQPAPPPGHPKPDLEDNELVGDEGGGGISAGGSTSSSSGGAHDCAQRRARFFLHRGK